MIRAVAEEALLFLLPFAVFALVLVVARRNPLQPAHWSGRVVALVAAGLLCVLASLVVTGLLAERPTGIFEPTHVENGRVVPGRFH